MSDDFYYWYRKGQFQAWSQCLEDLFPNEGKIDARSYPESFYYALEAARCATNLYYQWYNNGDLPGCGNSAKDGASNLYNCYSYLRSMWGTIGNYFEQRMCSTQRGDIYEEKVWPWKKSVWGIDWIENVEALYEEVYGESVDDDDDDDDEFSNFVRNIENERKEHMKDIDRDVSGVFEDFMDAILRWARDVFDQLTDQEKNNIREIAIVARATKPWKEESEEAFLTRWAEFVPRKSKRRKIN